jgi:hypothetical protein
MERKAVSSSNIRSVGHDVTSNTLEVEFTNGSVFQYAGVPRELADQMVKAESVGSFFARNVRSQFQAKRLDAAA